MKILSATEHQQKNRGHRVNKELEKKTSGHFKLDQQKRDVNRTSKINGARLLI